MCDRLSFVILGMIISDKPEHLLLIGFFESPALRYECIVENVGVLCLESNCLNDLSYFTQIIGFS